METKSGDNAKLIVAGIGLLIGLITMVNAIPVVILLAGAYLARRGDDPHTVRTTTRTVQAIYGIAVIICFVYIIYYIPGALRSPDQDGYDYQRQAAIDAVTTCGVLSLIGVIIILMLSFIWMNPMMRRIEDRSKETKDEAGPSIMKRDSLASYSVADELRKWRDLRDDGTITDAEFQAARTRILADD